MASGYRQFLWTCPLCVINRRAAAAQSRGSCCDAAAPSRSDPRIRVVQHRPPMLGLWTRPGDPVGTPSMWSVSTAWMRSGPSVHAVRALCTCGPGPLLDILMVLGQGSTFEVLGGWFMVAGCGFPQPSSRGGAQEHVGAVWAVWDVPRIPSYAYGVGVAPTLRDCVGCSVWLVWAAAATLTKAVGA